MNPGARSDLASLIRQKALSLGFDDVGFGPASELLNERQPLASWLANGYNAGMKYMANHFEKRLDPSKLVEGGKTVVSLLLNYAPEDDALSRGPVKISRYAYGIDYHEYIKGKLAILADYIISNAGNNTRVKSFVDSAPLLEKSLAVRAGLGWIGKNSLFIHKKLGSYLFLAELVINIQLPYSRPFHADHCGNCSKCIDACPTRAIMPGRTIDANRCISYLTIENKSQIPIEFKSLMSGWIFGCDACQEVCPWNRDQPSNRVSGFKPKAELLGMSVENWQSLSPGQFNLLFKGSVVRRAKLEGLKRNIDFIARKG